MKVFQQILGFLILILLINCSMMEYRDYKELHKHQGNKKYEVAKIVPENKEAAYIHFDTVDQNFVLDAYYEPIKKDDSTYLSLKVDKYGNVKDTFSIHTILKNGTMWDRRYYSNWIINGDSTKHYYIKPFSDRNYSNKEWLKNYKKIYDKASVSYYFNGTYYLNQ